MQVTVGYPADMTDHGLRTLSATKKAEPLGSALENFAVEGGQGLCGVRSQTFLTSCRSKPAGENSAI
jgi:hypothetical protein